MADSKEKRKMRKMMQEASAGLDSTQSANSISNRDLRILTEEADRARALRKAREAFLSGEMGSANPISNRDARTLEEAYMKRNDGGMAMSGRGKPVRTF